MNSGGIVSIIIVNKKKVHQRRGLENRDRIRPDEDFSLKINNTKTTDG